MGGIVGEGHDLYRRVGMHIHIVVKRYLRVESGIHSAGHHQIQRLIQRDGLFAGLDSGRYDMVVNGVEITDERAEKYDFTEPYGYIRTALIVADDNEEIKTFEDLNGKTTTNSMASTYMCRRPSAPLS